MRYKFVNLKHVIAFYHKVPRRKRTALAIVDTVTGELLKVKVPKYVLHD